MAAEYNSPPPILSGQQAPQMVAMPAECLDRFARNFEASARRWELIVYPSLFAFIVLASYFFFLIYHLTSDVGVLARNVSSLTQSVDKAVTDLNTITTHMTQISGNISDMSKNMDTMSSRMTSMDIEMASISAKLETMPRIEAQMVAMNQSVRAISTFTDHMRYSVSDLNRGINRATGPFQSMSGFMPW
jgi:uncharacterized protein YoxC